MPDPKPDFEKRPVPDALKELGVDPKTGLSADAAKQRLAQYGPKALEEKKKSELAVLLATTMAGVDADRQAAHPEVVAALAGDLGDDPLGRPQVNRGTTHVTVGSQPSSSPMFTGCPRRSRHRPCRYRCRCSGRAPR